MSTVNTLDVTLDVDLVEASVTVTVGGSTTSGGTIRVEDEGATVVAGATALNFAGAGVTVTDAGLNEALVTISGGGGGTVDVVSNVATDRVLGRDTAGSGDSEELTVGGGIEFTGTGGLQTSALTGDVTKAAGGTATTIAADAVTNAKAADMAQSTVKGRAAGAGTGDPTDLTAAQVKTLLAILAADIADFDTQVAATAVLKSLYDANTVLTADTDNTPAALTMGASTILARLASGGIVAATPAQLRTLLALVIGTNVQAWDADLDAIAALSTTAYGRSLLEGANAAALRTLAGLVIGTDVQAFDAELAALAGLVSAADKGIQFTGAGTAGTFDLTAAGKALLDDAAASDQRTTLGLGSIATQAASSVTITGGSVTGITDIAVADGGTGASTAADARTNLGLVIGTNVQAFDADLTKRMLRVVIDGAGSALTTGAKKAYLSVPWDCTITKARLLADVSGSVVVDVWRDTYANFPPTVADTITASAKPTLSSAQKSEDSTLTGWTTALTAGDVLEVNVDSATTVTRVFLDLFVSL